MEIEYIRKLMSSHMVIAQAAEMAAWEEKMIAHAKVDGILFAECVRENGKNYLWYDITGKQSLDTVVESSMLGHELLCKILLGLYETVEHLEQLLLRAEGVLLMPECIFQDYRTEQIFFCYYPGTESTMAQSLATLFEYLLARLDHGDERAVELAYGVYEQVSKGDISIREIKELIHIPYEEEESADGTDVGEAYVYQEEVQMDESKEQECPLEAELEDENIWEMEKKELKKRIGIKKAPKKNRPKKQSLKKQSLEKNSPKENRLKLKMQMVGKWNILSWLTGLLPKPAYSKVSNYHEEDEDAFVFEPEEESVPQNVRPTVLLSTIAQKPQGILRYEGKEPLCSDLKVTGTSYVIGSESSCDGCVPSTTVSRRHARITVKEDIYFIEDLNSSNGTYVGGEMLGYKNKVSLQKNEIVIFADEKFRFI